jgi:hypothetical protein
MRKLVVCTTLLVLLMTAVNAQSPNFNAGPVWRVNYVRVNPGHADTFWNEIRQHFRPIWDEWKKQGLITDVKYYVNPVTNNPEDWTVAIAVLYPNWAALDQLAAKGDTIATAHYGSRQALMEATRKRNEYSKLLSSHLAREVTLK